MKEPAFYIQKTDDLINRSNKVIEDSYNNRSDLDSIVLETELLFYGYSENYPALLDIKQIKEKYKGWYYDYETSVARKLVLVLSLFKSTKLKIKAIPPGFNTLYNSFMALRSSGICPNT